MYTRGALILNCHYGAEVAAWKVTAISKDDFVVGQE
jgi:hypothetical protein